MKERRESLPSGCGLAPQSKAEGQAHLQKPEPDFSAGRSLSPQRSVNLLSTSSGPGKATCPTTLAP